MKHYFFPAAMAALVVLAACSKDDDHKQAYNPLIDEPRTEDSSEGNSEETTAKGSYDEQYRPQVHFTPARNWMNDPNGMVYADGTYHLFYQYNPQANVWGNMSWGHATSTDLMHWQEQPVALTRDELGAVFSGSCVIDRDNTAGFGPGAMVALYTSAGESGAVQGRQQQSMAYSTDGGKSFTRFAGNPVISNDDDNLRDPKVFWHEASGKWIMVLAKGWKRGVELYGSSNLRSWHHLSTFVVPLLGRPDLQWECPDLFQMGHKWVLLVSVNPGGPVIGSGLMYFTGQFDGNTFTADERQYPLWLDYGMDNYAAVTWSNTGERRIMLGWMNNWAYSADVPCSPWRSAMTLPRELRLVDFEGKPLLCSTVVREIDRIAGQWQPVSTSLLPLSSQENAYQLRLTLPLDKNTTVTLSNGQNERFSFDISAAARTLTVHRTAATGNTKFNGSFSIPSISAPLSVTGSSVTLDVFVDQSSVELFTQEGTMAMTNLVFPKTIYNTLSVSGPDCQAQLRELRSVWR